MTLMNKTFVGFCACTILLCLTRVSIPGTQTGPEKLPDFVLFPADKATNVNPDTHLQLTFRSAPVLGKSGQIRIYDVSGHQLIDTLDLSIPAGPDPSRSDGGRGGARDPE